MVITVYLENHRYQLKSEGKWKIHLNEIFHPVFKYDKSKNYWVWIEKNVFWGLFSRNLQKQKSNNNGTT